MPSSIAARNRTTWRREVHHQRHEGTHSVLGRAGSRHESAGEFGVQSHRECGGEHVFLIIAVPVVRTHFLREFSSFFLHVNNRNHSVRQTSGV